MLRENKAYLLQRPQSLVSARRRKTSYHPLPWPCRSTVEWPGLHVCSKIELCWEIGVSSSGYLTGLEENCKWLVKGPGCSLTRLARLNPVQRTKNDLRRGVSWKERRCYSIAGRSKEEEEIWDKVKGTSRGTRLMGWMEKGRIQSEVGMEYGCCRRAGTNCRKAGADLLLGRNQPTGGVQSLLPLDFEVPPPILPFLLPSLQTAKGNRTEWTNPGLIFMKHWLGSPWGRTLQLLAGENRANLDLTSGPATILFSLRFARGSLRTSVGQLAAAAEAEQTVVLRLHSTLLHRKRQGPSQAVSLFSMRLGERQSTTVRHAQLDFLGVLGSNFEDEANATFEDNNAASLRTISNQQAIGPDRILHAPGFATPREHLDQAGGSGLSPPPNFGAFGGGSDKQDQARFKLTVVCARPTGTPRSTWVHPNGSDIWNPHIAPINTPVRYHSIHRVVHLIRCTIPTPPTGWASPPVVLSLTFALQPATIPLLLLIKTESALRNPSRDGRPEKQKSLDKTYRGTKGKFPRQQKTKKPKPGKTAHLPTPPTVPCDPSCHMAVSRHWFFPSPPVGLEGQPDQAPCVGDDASELIRGRILMARQIGSKQQSNPKRRLKIIANPETPTRTVSIGCPGLFICICALYSRLTVADHPLRCWRTTFYRSSDVNEALILHASTLSLCSGPPAPRTRHFCETAKFVVSRDLRLPNVSPILPIPSVRLAFGELIWPRHVRKSELNYYIVPENHFSKSGFGNGIPFSPKGKVWRLLSRPS
ncbi:hypothetical protein CCUS01_09069 [Colletotrichum cuscutae]|uniref:Uncharacterized protein n=1 Tax=Colletotrichum cuscutae TaxID=1209917 RepID=A0AAI9XQ77_9PEZI|nr:hypothetical protein CCUS01_09069 [Colletotrichum cuscutae]